MKFLNEIDGADKLIEDTGHRLVSDTEKETWNGKQNELIFDSIPTALSTNPVTSDGIKTALDVKVDNTQVLTNVPTNAKFTDTVTTINGKTGAIAKADITALGIPAQDTVYTHPSTHSADMITDGTNNKAFTATEKNKLSGIETGANKYTHPTTAGNKHIPTGGSSGQVLKYSSSGTAVWGTDNNTITTINGKTGAITKSDITALGIPSQDTTYSNATTTVSGLMSGADKTKLNGIDSNAVKITLGTTQPTSGWWFKEI